MALSRKMGSSVEGAVGTNKDLEAASWSGGGIRALHANLDLPCDCRGECGGVKEA